MALYLDVEEDSVYIATSPEDLLAAAARAVWDVVLLTLRLPTLDAGFEVFQKLRRIMPDCPVVGTCDPRDVIQLARFISAGLRSHVIRDSGGDFVFLLHVTLQSAVQAVRAEREQKLAERLREEVDSVRKLQESIIPKDLCCPSGYGIQARYEPSQIAVLGSRPVVLAGGDYYDVFRLDQRHVVILLGDASGHGMKACMSIMTMHTLVRMIRGSEYNDTARFVAEINERLCQQSVLQDEGGFITLLYAVLDSELGELQWTSAGHPPPLIHRLSDGAIDVVGPSDDSGLPLGIYPEVEYESHTLTIPRGSRILMYTDGLVEAFPSGIEHVEFGIEGVSRTLVENADRSLGETLRALFVASHTFTGGVGRHDDTSVVLLERE